MADVVAAAVERFGGVDVLVNNAGLHMGRYNLTSTLPLEDWRRLFDVNVFGAVLCAHHCHAPMKARGGGVILNQSSNSSYLGVGAYSTSKLALNGVTLSLAQELAPDGIRVVGIAPGMVASDAVLARLEDHHKRMVLDGQLVNRFGTVDDLVETRPPAVLAGRRLLHRPDGDGRRRLREAHLTRRAAPRRGRATVRRPHRAVAGGGPRATRRGRPGGPPPPRGGTWRGCASRGSGAP